MNKKLFKIDDSERQRILEMHQSATKKQYLGEDVTTTQTTTPPVVTPKVITPSIAPAALSALKIQNSELKIYKNGQPVILYVYVKPQIDKNNQPIPGAYRVEVSNTKEIPGLVYQFTYKCDNPEKVTQDNYSSKTPKASELTGISAYYGGKMYENKITNYTEGFEQKSFNQIESLLSQIKSPSIVWDKSNFSNLPNC